jgi:phosphoribosylformylglycinamidine synthase
LEENDLTKLLFAENCGLVFQASEDKVIEKTLSENDIDFVKLGSVTSSETLQLKHPQQDLSFSITEMRDAWFKTSYLLDQKQSANGMAAERFRNYKHQPLAYNFPKHFTGKLPVIGERRLKAAIIREKEAIANVKWQTQCTSQDLM